VWDRTLGEWRFAAPPGIQRKLKSDEEKIEMAEDLEIVQCGLMLQLRSMGVSLRSIAKCFGISKSKLSREWQAVEIIARYGKDAKDVIEALSQAGQLETILPRKTRKTDAGSVPNGTHTHEP
jgi:hypothetical protein